MSAPNPRTLQDAAAAILSSGHVAGTRVDDSLTGPARGRLAEFAQWLASCQGRGLPTAPTRVRLLLVEDSAGRGEDTTVPGTAEALGIRVRHEQPAADTDTAIASGIARADSEADGGGDLLVLAIPTTQPGGASTAGLAVISALAGVEPSKLVARGVAATDPEPWMANLAQVRDLRLRLVDRSYDTRQLLAATGSGALAFATGLLLQSAARRTPVVLDGVDSLAAALVARSVEREAAAWWIAADTSVEPAAQHATAALRIPTVLSLSAARGDGSSGVLSVPVLRESVTVPQTGTHERGS